MLREYDKWFLPYWNIFHEVTQDRRSHDPRQRQAVLPWRGRDHHRGGPPDVAERTGPNGVLPRFCPSPRATFKCEPALIGAGP